MLNKSYCSFMDEITADELYEGLLAHGLFAEKMPQVFTSVPFFDYCKSLSEPFKAGRSDFITYRVMRNISIPRIMGIPTPMKYQRLCSELRDNWDRIKEHFHTQTDEQEYRISRIHIRKKKDDKSIFEMNYKNWHVDGNPESDLLIQEKGASRFLVKADISTCFPSIYTHSIPWALVSKEYAKKNEKKKLWYNSIDHACSDMRNGETHGLLIGPHASNLLSEIILTVVDKKLYSKGYRYTRSIDDYDCYACCYDEAKLFLLDLEEALRDFDLQLNHKKTEIIDMPISIDKNWKHQLNELPTVGKSGKIEYPQVNKYIDTALKLARDNVDYAIINYAIKTLNGKNLTDNAKKLAAKRFMHLALIYPYLLHLMEAFVFKEYDVDSDEIKKFSDAIYKNAVRINDYESICYAIYFSLKHDFILQEFDTNYDEAISYISKSRDCLTLILTWIYFMKHNHWNRKATQVKPLNKVAMDLKNKDMDRYWLFCYEALSYGSLQGEWRSMKKAGVSFIRKEFKNC